MKKTFLFAMFAMLGMSGWAQTTVELGSGDSKVSLADAVTTAGITPSDVTDLTITGVMNDADVKYFHENFTNVVTLDLSGWDINTTDGSATFQVTVKNENNQDRTLNSNMGAKQVLPNALCYGFSALQTVKLPTATSQVGQYAFADCPNLKSVDFGSNANFAQFQGYAFMRCTSLESLDFSTFKNNFSRIYENVFNGCTALKTITFPTTNAHKLILIGAGAFRNCSSLESFYMPMRRSADNVEIAQYAFNGCTKLASIEFGPEPAEATTGVLTIANNVFNGTALTSFTAPKNLKSIGQDCFNGIATLTSLTFPEDGVLETIGGTCFYGTKIAGTIIIPASVKTLTSRTFHGVSTLTGVVFAEGSQLETIGPSAFLQTSIANDIIIPASVTTIGNGAFGLITSASAHALIFESSDNPLYIDNQAFRVGDQRANWQFTKIVFGRSTVPTFNATETNPFLNVNKANIPVEFTGAADNATTIAAYQTDAELAPFFTTTVLDETGTTAPTFTKVQQHMTNALTRTFVEGWNTLVLPYSVGNDELKRVFGDEVQVATFDKYTTAGNLSFQLTEDGIEAGVPVIINIPAGKAAADNVYNFTDVNVTSKTPTAVTQGAEDNCLYKATFTKNEAINIRDNGTFFLQNGNLYYMASGQVKTNGLRGWFELKTAKVAGVREAKVVFGDDETTSIEALDGEIVSGKYYDLQGRRVAQPQKGLYIVNGKKVVVK